MKVFLSWSGDRSKQLAIALRGWLPLVLHYVKPWISEKDIAAGDRWSLEVGKELEESNYGIICLTKENLDAPWILFEAGALSKALAANAVCPYLLDVEFSDITGPLSQFQAKKAEKDATLQMVQSINSKAAEPIGGILLTELFDALWAKLEQRLQQLPAPQSGDKISRTQAEILEELVIAVRGMDQRIRNVESGLQNNTEERPKIDLRKPPALLIIADEDIGKLKRGDRFRIRISARLIDGIARVVGVNPDEFGSFWYLTDDHTGNRLTKEDCENILAYFGDREPLVRLTTIPF